MNSNELFKKFCCDRNIKKSAVKGYESALKKYSDFHRESIDYLINEALDDEIKPLKKRKIKSRLLDFRSFFT